MIVHFERCHFPLCADFIQLLQITLACANFSNSWSVSGIPLGREVAVGLEAAMLMFGSDGRAPTREWSMHMAACGMTSKRVSHSPETITASHS